LPESFQPYVDEAVNAQIDSGTTSSKGRIRYRGEDSQPQIRYEGDLSVDDVKSKTASIPKTSSRWPNSRPKESVWNCVPTN
jgi:hypothetical protein